MRKNGDSNTPRRSERHGGGLTLIASRFHFVLIVNNPGALLRRVTADAGHKPWRNEKVHRQSEGYIPRTRILQASRPVRFAGVYDLALRYGNV